MLLMFEAGIRGGITQAVHRHTAVNNKYMDNYNPNTPASDIQYLDASNLYGWTMSQPLQTEGFKWVNVNPNQINELGHEDKGYLLEVVVRYPTEIHDSHDELPFLSNRLEIKGVTKLVPNLRNKTKYVVHVRALAQSLEHGLTLKHIHRTIEFNQSAWMKP